MDDSEHEKHVMKMESSSYSRRNRNTRLRFGVNALSRSPRDDEPSVRKALEGKGAAMWRAANEGCALHCTTA